MTRMVVKSAKNRYKWPINGLKASILKFPLRARPGRGRLINITNIDCLESQEATSSCKIVVKARSNNIPV
jgi:hypothetical protein